LIARGGVDDGNAVRKRSGSGKTDTTICGNGHEAESGDSRISHERASIVE
jgi:hypothetical protein